MEIVRIEETEVDAELNINFDNLMIMKEKRRTSRSKGKKTHEKSKIKSAKSKQRNVRNINYDPIYYEKYYKE